MKDFDDFAQLVDRTTDQDMARIFANVIEQMNLPKDANGNVSFSVEDLMPCLLYTSPSPRDCS